MPTSLQDIEALSLAQLTLFCVRAEGEEICPRCKSSGPEVFQVIMDVSCPTCRGKGTRRIPLLEGVRETCPNQHMYSDGQTGPEVPHNLKCQCHGLGYRPTENAGAWLRAAHAISLTVEFVKYPDKEDVLCTIFPEGVPTHGRGKNHWDALHRALARALWDRMVDREKVLQCVRQM